MGKLDPACRWGFSVIAASGHACTEEARCLDGMTNIFAKKNTQNNKNGIGSIWLINERNT